MAQFTQLSANRIYLVGDADGSNGIQIIYGTAVTRATVRAAVDVGENQPPIGSIYHSTDRSYKKVAAAGADTDWQKITTSAAD